MSLINTNLLSDKYVPLCLPENCLVRPRLLTLFSNCEHAELIVVSAPAGYGKTISTIQWLQHTQRKYSWLSLDHYDNQLSCFYRLFCRALLAFQPENHKMEQLIHHANFSLSPIDTTIKAIQQMVPPKEDLTVVLDDFHTITEKNLLHSFFEVQQFLPKKILLVLLTRDPIVSADIKKQTGKKCSLIHSANLAFTIDETKGLFELRGYSLTAENLQHIHAITEGWGIGVVAILQNGELNLMSSPKIKLTSYIKNQIWNDWPLALQNFMLKTSVVDEMTPALCTALTGIQESRQQLDQLLQQNPFLRQVDQQTYRYHQLLLDFLRQKNAESSEISALHGIAADHYLDRHERMHAIRHAIKSQDTQRLIQALLAKADPKQMPIDEYLSFIKVLNLEDLPDEFCLQYPFLYLYKLIYFYLSGDVFHLMHYFDQLTETLPVVKKAFPQYYAFCIFEFLLDPRKSLSELLEFYHTTLLDQPLTTNSPTQFYSLTGQAPFLHRSLRNYVEFVEVDIAAAVNRIYRGLFQANGEVIGLCIQCGIALEQNDLTTAGAVADRIQPLLSQVTIPEVHYAGMLHLTDVCFSLHQTQEVKSLLHQTEAYLNQTNAEYLYPNLVAYRTKIRLLKGEREPADSWLNSYFVTDLDTLYLHKTFQYLTTIRAFIVTGHYEKAIQLAIKLKTMMADFQRPLDLAETYVLQAIAERARGNPHFAQDSLIEALKITAAYGFIQTIATESQTILPILKELQQNPDFQEIASDYFEEVLCTTMKIAKKRSGMKLDNDHPVKLSPQKLRVLRLLSKGATYKEIMAKTGLTIYTVKAHASNLYRKLDVPNSAAAIAKARKLGLLDQKKPATIVK